MKARRKKKRRMTQAQLKRLYKRAGLEWKPTQRLPSFAPFAKKHKLDFVGLVGSIAYWPCICGELHKQRSEDVALCIPCCAKAAYSEYNQALIAYIDESRARLEAKAAESEGSR